MKLPSLNELERIPWFARYMEIQALVIVLVGFLILLSIVFWPFVFALFWSKFDSVQQYWWARLFMTLLFTGLAFILYHIRSMFRGLYGIGEVVIGVVICWISLRDVQASRMVITLALASAVYVMVRGMDNWAQGRAENREIDKQLGF